MTVFSEVDGVLVSVGARRRFARFEEQYSAVRRNEGRAFSIQELRSLPVVPFGHPQFREWRSRRNSVRRFLEYLHERGNGLKVLDVGCGNGFFSNLIARAGNHVTGVDVNLEELHLAAKAFGNANPSWYYADILQDELPVSPFDLAVFSASIQYFPDPAQVIRKCLGLLVPGGSVHILDSPFYADESMAAAARQRSRDHFLRQQVPGMAEFYHFHSWKGLQPLRVRQRLAAGGIFRKLTGTALAFPWLEITTE